MGTLIANELGTSFIDASFGNEGGKRGIFYHPSGYLFVVYQWSNVVQFYRFNPGSVPAVNATPTATFTTRSTPIELDFYENGADSILAVANSNNASGSFYRFDPTSVGLTGIAETGSFTVGANGVDVSVAFLSGLLYVAIATSSSEIKLFSITPASSSGAQTSISTITTSADLWRIILRVNGSFFHLFAASRNVSIVELWRISSTSIPPTITTVSASFQSLFGPDALAYYEDGANSILLSCGQFSGIRTVRGHRFDPTSVATTNTAPTFNLTPQGEPPKELALVNIGADLVCFVGLTNNRVEVFRFTRSSVTGNINRALTIFTLGRTEYLTAIVQSSEVRLFQSQDFSPGVNYWQTDLNQRTLGVLENVAQDVALTQSTGGILTLNAGFTLTSNEFLTQLRAGAALTASGLGVRVFGYAYTFISESAGIIAQDIYLLGIITGLFWALTGTSGYVIRLGTAASYNYPITVPSGAIVEVTRDLTLGPLWVFSSGSIIRSVGGSFVVTIPYADPGITLQGGATLITPTATLRLFNLPTVANTVLRVKDLTSLVVTNPSPVAGEVTITVNAARSYEVRADAPGYLMQRVTLLGSTPEFAFSLQNFRTLYNSGSNISAQIAFNYGTLLVTITDSASTITFADMFRTIEDYLATTSGLEFDAPPYPVILPDRNILWFPLTPAAGVNPVRVKPNAANTTDPTLLFETYLEGAADPTYSLFDFVGVGGRIIRVSRVVAIANPDLQAIRDAMKLAPSAGAAAVASIDNKLDAAARNAIVTR
jgi:hypothetical protein